MRYWLQIICTVVSIVSVISSVCVQAAVSETTMAISISSGSLTMYAGDSNNNDDLCTADSGIVESLTCSATERTIALSGLSVSSNRQNTTGVISDILFEDLRGLTANPSYTISATISNFTDKSQVIALGSNPDGATTDTDLDAPTSPNTGKIFATIDPSAGTINPIAPSSTQTPTNRAKFSRGSKTTVISINTPITILTTGSNTAVRGRYEIDGVIFKLRIPAYTPQGSYTGTFTQTII